MNNSMSTELVPINILVGDRTYRIRTSPSDEEVVRKTLKTINDKIIEFKTQFAGKDMQDYIAMVILWYATQASSNENQPENMSDLVRTLAKLEEQLDKAL